MKKEEFHIRLEAKNPGKGHMRSYRCWAGSIGSVEYRGELWTDRPPRAIGHLLSCGCCGSSRHRPQLPSPAGERAEAYWGALPDPRVVRSEGMGRREALRAMDPHHAYTRGGM